MRRIETIGYAFKRSSFRLRAYLRHDEAENSGFLRQISLNHQKAKNRPHSIEGLFLLFLFRLFDDDTHAHRRIWTLFYLPVLYPSFALIGRECLFCSSWRPCWHSHRTCRSEYYIFASPYLHSHFSTGNHLIRADVVHPRHVICIVHPLFL